LAEATPESVRAAVVAHLDSWVDNGDPFSWPDNGLARYGWQYGVHCWCVGDWNATGRAEPFTAFLRAWVQDDAKVANALKDPGGWFKVARKEIRTECRNSQRGTK
jgi:hypothetical protein